MVPLYIKTDISILTFTQPIALCGGDDGFVQDVFQLNESIYSQNILGVVGINAAGKTTMLNFLKFVLGYLAGPYSMRGFSDDRLLMGKMNDVIVVTAVFLGEGFVLSSRVDD